MNLLAYLTAHNLLTDQSLATLGQIRDLPRDRSHRARILKEIADALNIPQSERENQNDLFMLLASAWHFVQRATAIEKMKIEPGKRVRILSERTPDMSGEVKGITKALFVRVDVNGRRRAFHPLRLKIGSKAP